MVDPEGRLFFNAITDLTDNGGAPYYDIGGKAEGYTCIKFYSDATYTDAALKGVVSSEPLMLNIRLSLRL